MPLPVRADYDSRQRRALDQASTYTRRMNEQMDLIDANLDNMSDSLKQRFKHIVASQLSLIKYRNGEDAFADNLNRYKKEASKMDTQSRRTTATSDRASRMSKEIASWHATHGSHEEESGYVDQYSNKTITEDGSFRAFSPEQIGSKKIMDDKNTKVEGNSIDTRSNRMSEQAMRTSKTHSNKTAAHVKSHGEYDPHRNSYNRHDDECNRPCNINSYYVDTKRNETVGQTEKRSTNRRSIYDNTESQGNTTGELSDSINAKIQPTRKPIREYNSSPVEVKTNKDYSNRSTSPNPRFKNTYRHDVNSAGSSYQNDLMSIRDNRKVKENHTYHSDNKNTSVIRSNTDKHTTDACFTDRNVSFDLQETVRPRSSTPVSEKYDMHGTRQRGSTPISEKYDMHGTRPRSSTPISEKYDMHGTRPRSSTPISEKYDMHGTRPRSSTPISEKYDMHGTRPRSSTPISEKYDMHSTKPRSFTPVSEKYDMHDERPKNLTPISERYDMHETRPRSSTPISEKYDTHGIHSPRLSPIPTSTMEDFYLPPNSERTSYNPIPTLTKKYPNTIQNSARSPYSPMRTSTIVDPNLTPKTPNTTRSRYNPISESGNTRFSPIAPTVKTRYQSPLREKHHSNTQESPVKRELQALVDNLGKYNDHAEIQKNETREVISRIRDQTSSPVHRLTLPTSRPTSVTLEEPSTFKQEEISRQTKNDHSNRVINYTSTSPDSNLVNRHNVPSNSRNESADLTHDISLSRSGLQSTVLSPRLHFQSTIQYNPPIVTSGSPVALKSIRHSFYCSECSDSKQIDGKGSSKIPKQENEDIANSGKQPESENDGRYTLDRHGIIGTGRTSAQNPRRSPSVGDLVPRNDTLSDQNNGSFKNTFTYADEVFRIPYANEADPCDLRHPYANEAESSNLRNPYLNKSIPSEIRNPYENEPGPSDLRNPYANGARHSDLRNSYAKYAESTDFRIPYANEDGSSLSQHRANNDNVTCANTLKSRTIDSYDTSPHHQSTMKHDPSQPNYTVNDDYVASSRNHNAGNSDCYGTSPNQNPTLKNLSQASNETASLVDAYANIKMKLYSSALTSLMTSLQNTIEDHVDKEFDREMWTALHGSIREISEDFKHFVTDIGSQENNNRGLEDFDHLYCLIQQLLTEGPCHRLKNDVDDTMWRLRSHLEDACIERRRLLPEVETIPATLQNLTECLAVCGERYFGKGSRRKIEVPECPEASTKSEESTSLTHGFLATANKIRQRLIKDHLTPNVIENVVKMQDKENDEKFSPVGTCSQNRSYNQQGRSLPKLRQRTNSPCYHDDDLAECDECSNDTIPGNDTFTEFQSAQTSFNDGFFTQMTSCRTPSLSKNHYSNNVVQFVQTPSTGQPSPCRNDYDEYLVKPTQIRQPSPHRKCQFQQQCVPSLSQYRKNELRDKAVFALLVFGIVKFLGHFGPGFLQIVYDLCIGILMFINCNIKLEQFDPHIT